MFGRKPQHDKVPSALEVSTIIGEACQIEGNFRLGSGTARLEGTINGDITGEANLIVGKDGKVFGNITVDHLYVYGHVKGNIKARTVELFSGSMVEGDITTDVLYVEKGSTFNGLCTMKKGAEAPSVQSSKVETSPTGNPSS